MSKQNPRITAQMNVVFELLQAEFDIEGYTGEFIDDNWKPNFHYYQGIEHYRQLIQDKLNQLEGEEKQWEAKSENHND